MSLASHPRSCRGEDAHPVRVSPIGTISFARRSRSPRPSAGSAGRTRRLLARDLVAAGEVLGGLAHHQPAERVTGIHPGSCRRRGRVAHPVPRPHARAEGGTVMFSWPPATTSAWPRRSDGRRSWMALSSGPARHVGGERRALLAQAAPMATCLPGLGRSPPAGRGRREFVDLRRAPLPPDPAPPGWLARRGRRPVCRERTPNLPMGVRAPSRMTARSMKASIGAVLRRPCG